MHLVTVPGDDLLKPERNLLLGNWCKYGIENLSYPDVIDQREELVSQLAQSKFESIDINELIEIENSILDSIFNLQSEFGIETCSREAWKIRLGYWTQYYVGFMIRKIYAIENVILNHEIGSASFYEVDEKKLVPKDSAEFLTKSSDPGFSSTADLFIWNFLVKKEIETEVITRKENSDEDLEIPKKEKRRTRDRIYWAIEAITSKLYSRQKYFLISSYLPIKYEILTHLKLGQLPFIRHQSHMRDIAFNEPRIELRKHLGTKLKGPFVSSNEEIILKYLFKVFPLCFMEGVENIEKITYSTTLPTSPLLIYTANNFAFDEVFKYWVSRKVESGSVYVAGQHGNNYGTSKLVHPIESETADYFLTWGWRDNPKTIPAFNFKVSRLKVNSNANGNVTIMQDMLPSPVYAWDTDFAYYEYFSDQLTLVNELLQICDSSLSLRLHASSNGGRFNELAKWRERFPDLQIDTGRKSIYSIWKSSRLVIHTYDSTGILECFSLGIPSLALFSNGLNHLRSEVKNDYSALVDAKIVFFEMKDLTNHVLEIWRDVDVWWKSEAVQSAINDFCLKYSRESRDPSGELASILKSLI